MDYGCLRYVVSAQIQFSYVSSLHDKLVAVQRSGSFKPMFTDETVREAGAYEALLTLSRDAGRLLRHSGTCCLRSVADVLEIEPDRLLVMTSTCRQRADVKADA